MNRLCIFPVKCYKYLVQCFPSLQCCILFKKFSKRNMCHYLRNMVSKYNAINIKSSSSNKDGDLSHTVDAINKGNYFLCIFPYTIGCIWTKNIDHIMGDSLHISIKNLGCPYIHSAINPSTICINNRESKMSCYFKRHLCFSASCGTINNNQFFFLCLFLKKFPDLFFPFKHLMHIVL